MAMKQPAEMNLSKDFLTIPEAAEYCGVSVSHFRREIKDSLIPSVIFMGKRLFKRDDLRKAIEGKYLFL